MTFLYYVILIDMRINISTGAKSLLAAIIITLLLGILVIQQDNSCKNKFGPNATKYSRGSFYSNFFTRCGCQDSSKYQLSHTTNTCEPLIFICRENNIPALHADMKFRPGILGSAYLECKDRSNNVTNLELSSYRD